MVMAMRFITLQSKDVVSANTGVKIGYVVDMEIDPICHCIQALIVEKFTPLKFICIFKGPPVIIVPIENIMTIGEDVIIVNTEC